jgi:4-hydroxy-L-threonine phosphate dehydrogenase PdxA
MMSMKKSVKIGMTLGDPAGIGPELILKSASYIVKQKDTTIFGSQYVLQKTARDLNMLSEFDMIKTCIVDCVRSKQYQYGKPTKITGRSALESIDAALQSNAHVIITPPIVKDVIRQSNPHFIGHTEYFADFFHTKNYAMVGIWRNKVIMLLTTHQPLRNVHSCITPTRIARKIELLALGLQKYFKISHPIIGVSSFNPHAFEFSKGEEERIQKGIALAQRKNITVEGPLPADSLFNRPYDGYLTIYHDQAMIYLKSKTNGLNFTLGLPVIRLSPLYGAALDIAGKNKAESSGLVTAIKTGVKLYRNARKYEQTCA